jgi:hypothetical protein
MNAAPRQEPSKPERCPELHPLGPECRTEAEA